MENSWVWKYQPRSTDEIAGQNKAVKKLKKAISSYKKSSKPILLHGPAGTGKTSAVYAIASELDHEIIEVNASDFRNKKSVNQIVGGAVGQQSLFSKGKIILVDEMDGLAGNKDRGGVQEIQKLAKKSSFPMVLTANNPYEKKLSKLRRKCNMIEFGSLRYTSIAARLKQIAQEEGIEADEDVLKKLARRADGDVRGAVNDFQAIASGKDKVTKEDLEVLGERNKEESIFQALVRVFKTTEAQVARGAFDEVQADLDELFLWVENNIDLEYKKPKDLAGGFDALSHADIFYGRIMRWQHYRFYVYCYDLITAGVALGKDDKYKGFTKYKRSRKPLRIWQANNKYGKKRSIGQYLAEETHTSSEEAVQSVVPYFKLAAKKNEKFLKGLSRELELDDKEVKWLKE